MQPGHKVQKEIKVILAKRVPPVLRGCKAKLARQAQRVIKVTPAHRAHKA